MIAVSRRVRRHEDRAGDPLDGLVNMFDLGIVLSLAFLLAALSALHLGSALAGHGLRPVTVRPGQTTGVVPPGGGTVIGDGTQVGKVYRLDDGRLVYVVGPSGAPSGAPSAGGGR